MAVKSKLVTKIIKKLWIPIVSPRVLQEQVVGEAFVAEPKSLVGKTMTANLMTIMNDIKKQQFEVKLKIVKVLPDHAQTELLGCVMVPSAVRRLIRRGKSRIDHVVLCKTKDNKNVIVKIFLVANSLVYNNIATKIRKLAGLIAQQSAAASSYDDFVRDILSHKLQEDLRHHLKKVYPIRICEIRAFEIQKERFHELEKKFAGQEAQDETKDETQEVIQVEPVPSAEQEATDKDAIDHEEGKHEPNKKTKKHEVAEPSQEIMEEQ